MDKIVDWLIWATLIALMIALIALSVIILYFGNFPWFANLIMISGMVGVLCGFTIFVISMCFFD